MGEVCCTATPLDDQLKLHLEDSDEEEIDHTQCKAIVYTLITWRCPRGPISVLQRLPSVDTILHSILHILQLLIRCYNISMPAGISYWIRVDCAVLLDSPTPKWPLITPNEYHRAGIASYITAQFHGNMESRITLSAPPSRPLSSSLMPSLLPPLPPPLSPPLPKPKICPARYPPEQAIGC